jgi:hypothetical protein
MRAIPPALRIAIVMIVVFGRDGFCQDRTAIDYSLFSYNALSQQSLQNDTLSGIMPDTLRARVKPYIVVGSINVPLDKTVFIEAGATLLFNNFTDLRVDGTLVARGTIKKPILFSSINDQSVHSTGTILPNPFDWDGIYIHAGSIGTRMSYCVVSYAVYGIKSDTKFIQLNSVSFRNNGKGNLITEGVLQKVSEKPFSYAQLTKDPRIVRVPEKKIDPIIIKRNALRYTSFAAVIAGAGIGYYYGMLWRESRAELQKLSTNDPNVLRYVHDDSKWNETRKIRDKRMLTTYAAGTLGLLGIIGVGWSFAF